MDENHEAFRKISFQLHRYHFCNLSHWHLQEIFQAPNIMVFLENYVLLPFHGLTIQQVQNQLSINAHFHQVEYFLVLNHDKVFFVNEEIKWRRQVLLIKLLLNFKAFFVFFGLSEIDCHMECILMPDINIHESEMHNTKE